MSAPVTEAHQNLAGAVWSSVEYHKTPHAAQLIADSEAKAVAELKKRADHWCDMHTVCAKERDQLRAEVERLKKQIKDDNRSYGCELRDAYGTIWEQATKGHDRAGKAERALAELREWLAGVIANERLHHAERKDAIARAEKAEAELHALRLVCGTTDADKFSTWVDRANARAEKAESELADIRALANRRNKRDHSQDTTHQLVAALDQALDIAQAELAQFRELDAERARMRQIAVDKRIRTPTPQTDEEAGSLIDAEEVVPADFARTLEQELATERARLDWLELRGPWDSWNGFGETGITLRKNIRAAIDAAMKEETK